MKENDINQIKINPLAGQQAGTLNESDVFSKNPNPALLSKLEELKSTKSQLREKETELEIEKQSRAQNQSKTKQLELKNIIEYLKTKVKDLIAFIRQKSSGDGDLSFKDIPEKNKFPTIN